MENYEGRPSVPSWAVALAGFVSGAVALGVAQLGAGVINDAAFPVVAVGNAMVDVSPPPLKDFAIRTFGENDKVVVIAGLFVVLALVSAAFGLLARRRLWYGMAGLGAFGVVGLLAVLTRPGASALDVLPTLLGVAAGAWTLSLLMRRMLVVAAPVESDSAEPAPAESGSPDSLSTEPGDASVVEPVVEPERPVVMRAGREPRTFDRRALLVGATGGLVAAGLGGVAGRVLAGRKQVDAARMSMALPRPAVPAQPLPAGADLRIKGLSPFVTPNADFYRVDTAFILPQVDPETWKLKIHGMVDKPLEISFAELVKRPMHEADITLTCVSNEVGGPYAGNARWLGVRMADVLREAGVQPGADMLLSTSADGWTCGTPLDVVMDGREALFAIAMNGETLSVEHGFPVRQVVPGLYGYVSATKWVVDIKVTRFDKDVAYWTPKGWSAKGPIKTQSRIDVPSAGASVPAGRTIVAGVAWAQHRGIDAVEVRVDQGGWTVARLAAVPNIDTWRQWSAEVDLPAGAHTIEVRATDAAGDTQTASLAPPAPDGATGYHSITIDAA
ncbi:molybdopterin-dependent oxidoreductase [Streptosporangium soli]|nr:molybdopterin-dependent oxidoreductase [Streptosporangium sp. KLBMP 9127]